MYNIRQKVCIYMYLCHTITGDLVVHIMAHKSLKQIVKKK